MMVNGMNKNPKGMNKEEKVGIALGAVAFIVVLLFFLVLGNMSYAPAESAAPQAPDAPPRAEAPVTVIQQEPSTVGLGDMLMMGGGVVLLIGFWVVASRFGWLSIEAVEEASSASAEVVAPRAQATQATVLPQEANIHEEVKSLTLDLARQEQKVEKLTLDLAGRDESIKALKEQLAGQTTKASELSRELSRRHQTIQRLSEERHQMGEQLQALHSLLGVQKGDSLTEKVEELKLQLAAALTTKEELSLELERLSQEPQFHEVKGEELRKFWLTVKLDGKPFMSRRRLERLYARMRVENLIWVRKIEKAKKA